MADESGAATSGTPEEGKPPDRKREGLVTLAEAVSMLKEDKVRILKLCKWKILTRATGVGYSFRITRTSIEKYLIRKEAGELGASNKEGGSEPSRPASRSPPPKRQPAAKPSSQEEDVLEEHNEPTETTVTNVVEQPVFLKVPDVAAQLTVSTAMVYRLCEQRKLGHTRVGKSYRFTQAQIDTFLKENTIPPDSQLGR